MDGVGCWVTLLLEHKWCFCSLFLNIAEIIAKVIGAYNYTCWNLCMGTY